MALESGAGNARRWNAYRQAARISFAVAAIAAIVVAMRFYTRFVIIKRRFWEDYSILAALVCSIAMSVFVGISKCQLLLSTTLLSTTLPPNHNKPIPPHGKAREY